MTMPNSYKMDPVIINDCVGWLHQPDTAPRKDAAILICSGAGDDFANGYRPIRILAGQLAAAGYTALRFDYPGTGDSQDYTGPNLWDAWEQSVYDAAAWLLENSSAKKIIFIGVRIGAILAAKAAAKYQQVNALILIEPYLTGRSYASFLSAEAKLRGTAATEKGIEAGELTLSAECLTDMRNAELAHISLRPDIAIYLSSRHAEEKLKHRLAPWFSAPRDIHCHELGGLEAITRPNHHTNDSELDSSQLLHWLTGKQENTGTISNATSSVPRAILKTPNGHERVLRFGNTNNLVGVLSEPKKNQEQYPLVLICNSGGNARHGYARFGVEFARLLTKQGIPSFRFDFSGIGDSQNLNDDGDVQTDIFSEDRAADISAAINTLEDLNYKRFSIHGLCSGAYHALLGACSENRISSLMLINLPWMSLYPERPCETSIARQRMNILTEKNVKSLFLFNETDPGLKQFERHFGPVLKGKRPGPAITVQKTGDIDHELTTSHARTYAAQLMLSHLLSLPSYIISIMEDSYNACA